MKVNSTVFASCISAALFVLTKPIAAQGTDNVLNCIDKSPEIVNAIAAQAGITIVDGCESPILQQAITQGNICKDTTFQGATVRKNCCQSCLDHHYPLPETQLPDGGDSGLFNEPVKLYLQAGQSECVGQASPTELRSHSDATGEYADLVVDEMDGVYIAGYNEAIPLGTPDQSRFFIAKMALGKEGKASRAFGPEIAIGRRLRDALSAGSTSEADVMIVKYCWGGSNIASQWNPATAANYWDRTADVGTSDHLLSVGAADLLSKNNLYGNLIYTARRAMEALDDANINYVWEGMFWIQGSADKERTWEEYGTDTKRLFTQVRTDLGIPDLPIVDNGAETSHSLHTGKIYSASTIPNCNIKVVDSGSSVANPNITDCVISASNVCPTFANYNFYDYYGIDPALTEPPYSDGLPDYLLDKNFTWYKSYPINMHSEYDGMIWKGNMVANEFIRTFTDWTLTSDMIEDDPVVLFPAKSCGRPIDPDYTPPAADNVCYIDERDDDALNGALCNVQTGKESRLRRKLSNGRRDNLRKQ